MAVNYQLKWEPGYFSTIFPLTVSSNQRFLQSASGSPFLINIAAASWNLIQAVSYADFVTFADQQKARGFNALHLSLISRDVLRFPSTAGNHFAAPDWNNGSTVAPFTSAGNYTTFSATYKAHAKACIDYLASIGLLAFLQLSYIGYPGPTGNNIEGWGDIMVADSDAHMTTYGQDAATLLLPCANVIPSIGGDHKPAIGSTIESRTLAVVNGFQNVDSGRLWVSHLDGDAGSGNGGDLSFDQANIGAISGMLWSHYAYSEVTIRARRRIRTGYLHSPTQPVVVLDPSYEGDPQTGSRLELRHRSHATMCEGACSVAYALGGSSPTGWVYLVSLSGTSALADHQFGFSFWNALPWYSMVPDESAAFVTAGRGTDGDQVDTYVSVRASAACLVAHFPNGAGRTITIAMSQFTGAGWVSGSGIRRARWFDPTTGSFTLISASLATSGTMTFGTSGTHGFPSGTNGAGDSDWLLVVD